jgi:competence protein ComEC
MLDRTLGNRAPLLWLVLPLVVGLSVGKAAPMAPVGWLLAGSLAAASAALLAARRAPRWWAVTLGGAMLLGGWASYALHRQRLTDWEGLPPREVELTLQVERIFPQKDPRRASGLARVVTRAGGHSGKQSQASDQANPAASRRPLQRILSRPDEEIERVESQGMIEPALDGLLGDLTGQRISYALTLERGRTAPLPSAVVGVSGVLTVLPQDPEANSFEGYLADSGINFRLNRGRIQREERPASAYARFCSRAAARFSAILGHGIATKRPELTAVLRAMLLGQQQELSPEQTLRFQQSGTMHLFSISGQHIAVIAGGLHALLSLLRLPRRVHLPLGFAALWLYVDITGDAPSAVRALLMVGFFQLSLALRLPANPMAALALSAAFAAVRSPLQVFGASFQMSYGIVAALLLLGLPLAGSWRARWTPFRDLPPAGWSWWQRGAAAAWNGMISAVALGLAASLVGAVSGVTFFGLITPGALAINLILIPVSSLVITSGFLSLLCGLAGCPVASSLFNHAAALVLWGADALVRGFVRLPAAWFNAHFVPSWLGQAVFAALLASLLLGYHAGWPRRFGGFWPPFLLTGLALGWGVRFD